MHKVFRRAIEQRDALVEIASSPLITVITASLGREPLWQR